MMLLDRYGLHLPARPSDYIERGIMKQATPVYLLAMSIILGAIALALFATPLPNVVVAAATPGPAATFHYSTVGSCGCEVQAAITPTPALTPDAD